MLSLIVCAALVALTAVVGAFFQPGAWYEALAKPEWTPPGAVFGPVWGTLYVLIAFAGWLAWRNTRRMSEPVMVAWGVQLVLNAAWSWMFFGLQRPQWALVDVFLLLTTILAFIALAWPRSKAAAALFVPYALWVGFASMLNLAIVRLN